MKETISALVLRSQIYEQMATVTEGEETIIVVRNKIVAGKLNGFSSNKLNTKKLTISFIDCIFKDTVDIDRIYYKHEIVLKIRRCNFLKSLSIKLWRHSSVYIEHTQIENKFYAYVSSLTLDHVSAYYCEISLSKEMELSVGILSVNTIRFELMYLGAENLMTVGIRCHISVLELISRMLPHIPVDEVYADKGSHIPTNYADEMMHT